MQKNKMLPFSPDGSKNPCVPSFGIQDCNGQREPWSQKCLLFLVQKNQSQFSAFYW